MTESLMLLAALVAVALIFDFLNGLHDAANSIATVVSTRVLSPKVAVAWAAFFNFVAFLFFGLHVAQTVGTGIISPDIIDERVIFGALMGAIVWNVLTWWGAIPSSSSHALIGGLIGAGAAKAEAVAARRLSAVKGASLIIGSSPVCIAGMSKIGLTRRKQDPHKAVRRKGAGGFETGRRTPPRRALPASMRCASVAGLLRWHGAVRAHCRSRGPSRG